MNMDMIVIHGRQRFGYSGCHGFSASVNHHLEDSSKAIALRCVDPVARNTNGHEAHMFITVEDAKHLIEELIYAVKICEADPDQRFT